MTKHKSVSVTEVITPHINYNEILKDSPVDKYGHTLITEVTRRIIDKARHERKSALHIAAEAGNIRVIKELLTLLTPEAIHVADKFGNIALRPAVIMGHISIVELLLHECPQMINIVDKKHKTILHWAKDSKIANLLLDKMTQGAINSTAKDGMNALQQASKMGYWQVVKVLLDTMRPETINAVTKQGSALHLAANEKVAELLIFKMRPDTISATNPYGTTALHLANDEKIVKLLISKMSQDAIDRIDANGKTALCLAVINGNVPKCKLLLVKMSPEAIEIASKGSNCALTQVTKIVGRDHQTTFNKTKDKENYEKVIALLHNKMLFGDVLDSLEEGGLNWKAINLTVGNCKALLSYLPKSITKIVYDYVVESCDTLGELIDETGPNYSIYKFKKILELAFKGYGSGTSISIYENKETFLKNIDSIEQNIKDKHAVVMLWHTPDNHWGGLIIRKNSFEIPHIMQFIYINPRGGELFVSGNIQEIIEEPILGLGYLPNIDELQKMQKKYEQSLNEAAIRAELFNEENIRLLVETIEKSNIGLGSILDLIQKNTHQSSDAFIVEVLIKLVTSSLYNVNNIPKLQELLATSINIDNLQLKHVELLQKAGILAALPEKVEDITFSTYALELQAEKELREEQLAKAYRAMDGWDSSSDEELLSNDPGVSVHISGEIKEYAS